MWEVRIDQVSTLKAKAPTLIFVWHACQRDKDIGLNSTKPQLNFKRAHAANLAFALTWGFQQDRRLTVSREKKDWRSGFTVFAFFSKNFFSDTLFIAYLRDRGGTESLQETYHLTFCWKRNSHNFHRNSSCCSESFLNTFQTSLLFCWLGCCLCGLVNYESL